MQLKTDAIVIRERKIDEQDRLLVLLTRDNGVISAYSKGARKLRGSAPGATELLSFSEFVLFLNRDKCYVDSAEPLHIFFGIRSDMEKLSLATYFCQLCCELIPEEENGGEFLRLFLNSLHFLEQDKKSPSLIKALFELRLLEMSGYMPDLVSCNICGGLNDGDILFLPQEGVFCCASCAGEQEKKQGLLISRGAFDCMRHILYSDFERLFSFKASPGAVSELSRAAEKFLICRVERILPALNFYKTIGGN